MVACSKTLVGSGSTRILRLSADSLAKIAEYMTRSNEVGGTIEPDAGMTCLVVKEGKGGGKDSVVIPIGSFQFHTHPNKCESRGNCYFEFPSENDMSLIAQDCMRGAVAHFVFTHGYVYRVAPSGAMRVDLGSLKQDKLLQKEVNNIFDDFHKLLDEMQEKAKKYGISPEIMNGFRAEWARTARSKGFDVTLIGRPEDIAETVVVVDPQKAAQKKAARR